MSVCCIRGSEWGSDFRHMVSLFLFSFPPFWACLGFMGNAVASWSLVITFCRTAGVFVLVWLGCESLSIKMCGGRGISVHASSMVPNMYVWLVYFKVNILLSIMSKDRSVCFFVVHIYIIISDANKVVKQQLPGHFALLKMLLPGCTTRGGSLYFSEFQHTAGFWFPVKKYTASTSYRMNAMQS